MQNTTIKNDFFRSFLDIISDSSLTRFRFFTHTKDSSTEYIINYTLFYLSYLKRYKINRIFFVPNASLESIIFTFFLIFLEFEVYILPSDFTQNSTLYHKLTKNTLFDNSLIFKFTSNKFLDINLCPCISMIPLNEFNLTTHPSSDIKKVFLELYQDSRPGTTVFTSSGSTGEPKLIPLTIESIDQCYRNCVLDIFSKINYNDICCVHSPSFVIVLPFLYGFLANSESVICAPACNTIFPVIQLSKYLPSSTSPLIISVPTILRTLFSIERLEIFSHNIISCGEPLDISLTQKVVESKPLSFNNLYGATEVSPWIIHLNVLDYLANQSDDINIAPILPAGSPFPEVSLVINDNDELLVSSLSVFDGYIDYSDIQPFQNINSKRYFNTGDRFTLDKGYYFCNGRSNSAVKICGRFVNPLLIESALKHRLNMNTGNILCIPIPQESRLALLLFLPNPIDITISNIKDLLSDIVPSEICFTCSLIHDPPTLLASGKIDRMYYTKDLTS